MNAKTNTKADITDRLLAAYADMRTGSREDLKEAAEEIISLRERLREAARERDQLFVRSSE